MLARPFLAFCVAGILLWSVGCAYDTQAEFDRANQPTPWTSVHGFVRLPDGKPAEVVRVVGLTNKDHLTIEIADDRFRAHLQSQNTVSSGTLHVLGGKDGTWTTETGEFTIDQPDIRALVIYSEQGYTELALEQVTDPLEATLQPWAKVEGTVRIGRKTPEDAVLMAEHRGGSGRMYTWRTTLRALAAAGDDGCFTMNRLPAGEVRLGRQIAFNVSGGVWLDLQPGRTQQVVIGGNGREITGALRLPPALAANVDWTKAFACLEEEIPPGPMFASAAYRAEQMRTTRRRLSFILEMAEDGTFRADDVPPGRYVLMVLLTNVPAAGEDEQRGRTVVLTTYNVVVPPANAGEETAPAQLGIRVLQPQN